MTRLRNVAAAPPSLSPSKVPANGRLQELYAVMARIRAVEQSLLSLFSEGLVRGTVHTCLGQEAIPAGIVAALDPGRDVICSNHRGHGHFLAWAPDRARALIAEIMGLDEGVCRGIGGSQHLHVKGFYSNGILGGMVGVANGMAFAEKSKRSGALVAAFMGDGALGEGLVYEAFNMAALWSLPLLVVLEQNQYAQSTPWKLEHAGDLRERAGAFRIPVRVIDGNDVLAVFEAAAEVVREIRDGGGPRMIFCETYRLGPHSKGDDLRDPAEIAAAWKRDPVVRLRDQLDPGTGAEIGSRVEAEVAEIVSQLKAASAA